MRGRVASGQWLCARCCQRPPESPANIARGLRRASSGRGKAPGRGDFAGAAADWRRAVALFENIPAPDGELVFIAAGCHASLSSLAGLPGTGLSAGERESEG